MGRPRKSDELRAVDGQARTNKKKEADYKASRDNVVDMTIGNDDRPAPTGLIASSPEAIEIWEHTVDLLIEQETLHKCDVLMLELFVFNALQLRVTSRDLLKHGHYDIADNGTSRRNALSVTFEKLSAAHHKYLRDLELTAATRPEIISGTSSGLDPALHEIFYGRN